MNKESELKRKVPEKGRVSWKSKQEVDLEVNELRSMFLASLAIEYKDE